MGYPVNSSRDDVYFFASSKDGLLSKAFVSSDRGSECCLSSYAVLKAPKKKIITGVILSCLNNEPVADAEVVMKDASGKTFNTTTNSGGKYSFELTGDTNGNQLSVQKESYVEKTAEVMVDSVNERGWLTDSLYSAALCMEKKPVIKVENVVSVYFDFDQSKLRDRGIVQLDSIYTVLVENPTATIQISGYTDGRGSVEHNKKLSDKRAKACADYLVQKGVDATRISFESFGACCPIEMEMINGRDNPDGRSLNRRALININKE
jgi:outer membrane protein OmpA-like peptidoglycan-associated protein